METQSGRSILVAAVPLAAERLRGILSTHRVICARTFEEAKQALSAEPFALAILGVYFAESRMFDMVALARGSASNRATPIVCVLGVRGGPSDILVRSLEQTINSMPLTVFLNLAAIPDDASGNASVRNLLDRYLHPGADPAQRDVARA